MKNLILMNEKTFIDLDSKITESYFLPRLPHKDALHVAVDVYSNRMFYQPIYAVQFLVKVSKEMYLLHI